MLSSDWYGTYYIFAVFLLLLLFWFFDSVPHLFTSSADEQDSDSFSGDCEYTYLIWMAVFAIAVLPFSLMDLTDQVGIRLFLCSVFYCRFSLFLSFSSFAHILIRY